MININNLNRLLLFSIFNISFMFIFLQKKYRNLKKNKNTQKYFSSLKNIKTQKDKSV